MNKSERLVIRLAADDRDWIRAEAERIGVDSATLVRMLIRQARMQGVYDDTPVATELPGGETSDAIAAEIRAEAAEDLDTLMAAAPSLLDEADRETASSSPDDNPIPAPLPDFGVRHRFQREVQRAVQHHVTPPRVARPAYAMRQGFVPPGAFRAGSMTRVVGTGDGAAGNITGDGIGNVIRDNFAHLGFVGTRSR